VSTRVVRSVGDSIVVKNAPDRSLWFSATVAPRRSGVDLVVEHVEDGTQRHFIPMEDWEAVVRFISDQDRRAYEEVLEQDEATSVDLEPLFDRLRSRVSSLWDHQRDARGS